MNIDVMTRQGVVRGRLVEGVATFKGIPYAAPPFDANRFQPPAPVERWDGIREALSYGPTAPKSGYFPPFDALLMESAIPGEDCLNLNIWTPDVGRAGLPVMVWIHGGSFANGSGAVPQYDGSRFARDGVVCVTINYRLGADGFLYLDDGISNLGMLDQVAALSWVQENIAAFGGDPHNVTIFGESAGAFSVSTLLAMPRARGLFRRAIAQSGAGHHVISSSTALRVYQFLAEKLAIEPTREAFAAIPIGQLLQAQVALSRDVATNPNPERWGELAANLMPFEPVVDGDILPARPIDSIIGGAGAGVDVIIGANSEEQRFFLVPTDAINSINEEMLAATVAAYGLPVSETIATYRTLRPNASAGDLLGAIVTDWFYRIPAIRLAEAHTNGSGATYMYEFAWRSPKFDGKLGACHYLEIAFVFDNLDKEGNEPLMGNSAPQQLADAMHSSWVAFARDGNPGWPRFDVNRRATMCFDTNQQIVEDSRSAERLLWEKLR